MSYLTNFEELAEPQIKSAVEQSRGDMLVAARILRIRLKDLMDACERVPALKTHMLMVNKTREQASDFRRLTDEQFEAALKRNRQVYSVVALDEMYEVATMPIDPDNAEMVNAKLKACVELTKGAGGGGDGNELTEVLRELNVLYRESAPRIKTLRMELTVQQGLPEEIQGTTIPALATPPASAFPSADRTAALSLPEAVPVSRTGRRSSAARGSPDAPDRPARGEYIPAAAASPGTPRASRRTRAAASPSSTPEDHAPSSGDRTAS